MHFSGVFLKNCNNSAFYFTDTGKNLHLLHNIQSCPACKKRSEVYNWAILFGHRKNRINAAVVCDSVFWLCFNLWLQCCGIFFFTEKPGFAMCVGCGSQIHDQYILRVSPDLEWHAACLKCAECSQYLDETCTCFVRDGKTYCKRDYVR